MTTTRSNSFSPARHSRTVAALGSPALAAMLLLVSGCAKDKPEAGVSSPAGGVVHASDFATAVDAAEPPRPAKDNAPPSSQPAIAAAPSMPQTMSIEPARPSAGAVDVAVGSAPPMSASARAASQSIVIDALVGQVNGKPIFASEVLEPLDGRLRGLSAEARTRDLWQRQGGKLIYDELLRRVRDELVLAEARAGLTQEQRQGLLFFLNEIQQNLVAGSRGSTVLADETIRENTSRSLAKEAQDRLDRELIANEFRQRILPRVSVSWRDVQNEYERNFEKYNPLPIAHLRLIVVSNSNKDAVASMSAMLGADARAFDKAAAERANEFNRAKGGEFPREFSGPFAQAKFSDIPEINEAMRSLSVGQVKGPIAYRDKTAWVYLEKIENRPGQSLYEAQYAIEQELKEERFRVEEQRYFDNLLRRGNVSKFEDMMTKLIAVAEERYMPASLLRKTEGPTPSLAPRSSQTDPNQRPMLRDK